MAFRHKKFLQVFYLGFVLLIILVGCSKQEEKWIYTVSSKIINDKNKIEEAHPDILDKYQNMALVEIELTSMHTTEITNLNIQLDFPQNTTMKLYSQGSSSPSIVKRNDKIEYLFDIILDQPLAKTRELLEQSKIIIEWEQNGKKERFEIKDLNNYIDSSISPADVPATKR